MLLIESKVGSNADPVGVIQLVTNDYGKRSSGIDSSLQAGKHILIRFQIFYTSKG
ncbi:MAG: hypothetical protein ACLSG8_01365 [Barnesiella sp.]